MSKLPHWFNLENYQRELSQMDWAFEIFIRLYSDERLEFVLKNLPFSNSLYKNSFFLLSHMLPNFDLDEAISFLEKEQNNVFEKMISRFDEKYAQHVREDPDFELELVVLNTCMRRFRKSKTDYRYLLKNMPFNVLFDKGEKQVLHEKFLHEHSETQARPIFFPELKISKHYPFLNPLGLPEQFWRDKIRKPEIKQPKAHTNRSFNPARPFRVNLAFSNKEILSAVEEYLNETRKTQVIGKSKLLKKLPNWKANQVLAIRDLTEWGDKWIKEKFTYAEIADAVWPPFAAGNEKIIDYAERVRKTSIPDIQEAFTEITYGLLLDTSIQPE